MKAFPTAVDNGHSDNQDGMDLRDYFAAKAMQGLLATVKKEELPLVKQIAEAAYWTADAMMEARKQ